MPWSCHPPPPCEATLLTHLDHHGASRNSRTSGRSHLRLPRGLKLCFQKSKSTVFNHVRSLIMASGAVLEAREFRAWGICPVLLMGGPLLGWTKHTTRVLYYLGTISGCFCSSMAMVLVCWHWSGFCHHKENKLCRTYYSHHDTKYSVYPSVQLNDHKSGDILKQLFIEKILRWSYESVTVDGINKSFG